MASFKRPAQTFDFLSSFHYVSIREFLRCTTDIQDDARGCQLHWWMQYPQVRTGGHDRPPSNTWAFSPFPQLWACQFKNIPRLRNCSCERLFLMLSLVIMCVYMCNNDDDRAGDQGVFPSILSILSALFYHRNLLWTVLWTFFRTLIPDNNVATKK